ncbi:MAG TPA: GGDEF domain-containing protein [Pseudomonadales bacterium]|nr:GGDEF domain-containing protein [Pseudomonadales bacterium]
MPALLERWMPACAGGNVNERVRVAITVMVLMVNMALCLVSLLFIEFFLSRTITVELQYARAVVYPCAALYVAAAFYLFYMKNYHVTRLLIVANILMSCYAGMMMTGGFTISPVTSLIVLPVMFSFLLMGVRAGILCALMMLCLFIPVSLMEIYGMYTPVQLIPNQFVWQSIALFVPLVGTALVVFSLIFYEMLTRRLQYALQEERNRFHWDATHDALTGLPNRPDFYHRLELAIHTAERNDQALALVIFDLDGFKPVNDKLGHHAGDMVLQAVGERLQAVVRAVDTVARIGGDEFAVILLDVSEDAELLDPVLQKILKAVAEPVNIDGKTVSVSASLGVAFYGAGCTLNELCKQADIAMYVAKKTKNTWHLYFEDSTL